jgi:hypothetical protein
LIEYFIVDQVLKKVADNTNGLPLITHNSLPMVENTAWEKRDWRGECPYNTYFVASLHLPEATPFPTLSDSVYSLDSFDDSSAPSAAPLSTGARSSPLSVSMISYVSSSSSNSTHLFETAPVKVSREKFDQLEKRVDLLLAAILNEDEDKTM